MKILALIGFTAIQFVFLNFGFAIDAELMELKPALEMSSSEARRIDESISSPVLWVPLNITEFLKDWGIKESFDSYWNRLVTEGVAPTRKSYIMKMYGRLFRYLHLSRLGYVGAAHRELERLYVVTAQVVRQNTSSRDSSKVEKIFQYAVEDLVLNAETNNGVFTESEHRQLGLAINEYVRALANVSDGPSFYSVETLNLRRMRVIKSFFILANLYISYLIVDHYVFQEFDHMVWGHDKITSVLDWLTYIKDHYMKHVANGTAGFSDIFKMFFISSIPTTVAAILNEVMARFQYRSMPEWRGLISAARGCISVLKKSRYEVPSDLRSFDEETP